MTEPSLNGWWTELKKWLGYDVPKDFRKTILLARRYILISIKCAATHSSGG